MPALDLRAPAKRISRPRARSRVYLFVGEDVKLIDRMVDAVEATIDAADRPFAVERALCRRGRRPADRHRRGCAQSCRCWATGASSSCCAPSACSSRSGRRSRARPMTRSTTERARRRRAVDLDAARGLRRVTRQIRRRSCSSRRRSIARRRFTKRLLEKATVVGVRRAGGRRSRRPPRRARRGRRAVRARTGARRAARSSRAACSCWSSAPAATSSKLRGDVERLLLYTEGQKRISRGRRRGDRHRRKSASRTTGRSSNAIADGDAARALREIGRAARPRRLAACAGRAAAMVGVVAAGRGGRGSRPAGARRAAAHRSRAQELRRRRARAGRAAGRGTDREARRLPIGAGRRRR